MSTYADTPVDAITSIHARITAFQATNQSYPLEWRKTQLRKLYWAVKDNEAECFTALAADLGKPHNEAYIAEIGWIYKDILYALDNLEKWAAPEGQPDMETLFKFLLAPRIRKDPIGTVLIIGAYNYPLQLVLAPLVGAIAAGCATVIKPSELCLASALVLEKIIARLDSDAYACVNGGIPQTSALLEKKWDKIMYTGSTNVAKIVSAAAAKHLTPCLLELGGLNPVIVTASANAKLAAKRTLWTKVHNCGQICIAADYVLLHPSQEAAFIEGCHAAIKSFLPNGTNDTTNGGNIVNSRHFNRIKSLLDDTDGTIILGGASDPARNWIEPTVVKVTSLDDSLLSEEIFGPVLPYYVVPTGTKEEFIKIANSICDTPLGFYFFSTDKAETEYLLSHSRSGGATVNDAMFHASLNRMPFGGVGQSGTGAYRGKASFDAFVHRRSVVSNPAWTESQMAIRYPPYTVGQLRKYLRTNKIGEANFGRDGKIVKRGFLVSLLSLGAGGSKGAVLRWLFAAVGVFVVKNYLEAK